MRPLTLEVRALRLPGNPLDLVIDELGGVDSVAEMTGRTVRHVRTYRRGGEYQNAPLFIHSAGQIWLLRYRLPSGNNWW